MLGIFQHVWVAGFPAVHPRTHLVLRVRARRTEIGVHTIRIRFVDDKGTELLGGEGTVQFGEPPAGVVDVEAGAVLVFDVPLPRAGPLRLRHQHRWGARDRCPAFRDAGTHARSLTRAFARSLTRALPRVTVGSAVQFAWSRWHKKPIP